MNTPKYSLAKYLNPILSPLTTNEFTVKNSSDFAEEVVNYDHNLHFSFFIFDNKLYKQIDRVSMGSPSHWLTPFSVIMKKFGLMNAFLRLNLWFTDVTLTIFLFCLNLKNI